MARGFAAGVSTPSTFPQAREAKMAFAGTTCSNRGISVEDRRLRIAGDEQNFHLGMTSSEGSRQLLTAHARQRHVSNNEVDGGRFTPLQSFLPRC